VVVVPNKNVVENTIINYSANETRKVVFTFDVAYSSDVERVKAIISKVIINHEKVLLEPTPFVALKTLASSSITFTASCWCNSADYWSVYYDIMDSVFNEFKRENISIPYNQLEVRLKTEEEVLPYRDDIIEDIVEEKKQAEADALQKKLEAETEIHLFPGVVIKKPKAKRKNKKEEKETK
jgi:small-conductance mechanosensitive channel